MLEHISTDGCKINVSVLSVIMHELDQKEFHIVCKLFRS